MATLGKKNTDKYDLFEPFYEFHGECNDRTHLHESHINLKRKKVYADDTVYAHESLLFIADE